ncbi:MAG: hypothetical protein J6P28_03145 [Treponema sp.]|nr:hypothetical protein [Treponema sp.]
MKYSSWFFMFLIVLMGNPELYEELKEGLENTFNGLKADLEEAKALSEKKMERNCLSKGRLDEGSLQN